MSGSHWRIFMLMSDRLASTKKAQFGLQNDFLLTSSSSSLFSLLSKLRNLPDKLIQTKEIWICFWNYKVFDNFLALFVPLLYGLIFRARRRHAVSAIGARQTHSLHQHFPGISTSERIKRKESNKFSTKINFLVWLIEVELSQAMDMTHLLLRPCLSSSCSCPSCLCLCVTWLGGSLCF